MDALPGYTYFNPTRKVLCAIQIVEDAMAGEKDIKTVFPHEDDEKLLESEQDSVVAAKTAKYTEANYGGLGKAVNELIEQGAYIDNNGSVIATLKPVDDYTGFSSEPTEQSGFYFPFEINVPKAKKMTLAKTTVPNGTYVDTKVDIPYDNKVILRVADDEGNHVMHDFRITTDNGKIIELHFDKVKFNI